MSRVRERLGPGLYSAVQQARLEPVTSRSQARRSTSRLPSQTDSRARRITRLHFTTPAKVTHPACSYSEPGSNMGRWGERERGGAKAEFEISSTGSRQHIQAN